MFAVKGWAVPSSTLKTQVADLPNPKPHSTATAAETDEVAHSTAKKRKRNNGISKASDVNAANLSDLWETVIEKKPKAKHANKRQKVAQDPKFETSAPEGEDAATKAEPLEDAKDSEDASKLKKEQTTERDPARLTLKEKRKKKKEAKLADAREDGDSKPAPQVSKTISAPLPAKPVAALTPLQASMRQKLVSARFRHLNQTLYTTPSAHSLELFQQNPEMFQEYHEGFRRQVEVWPENPVDSFIREIKLRGLQRAPNRNKPKPSASADATQAAPLPRTEGTCYIADLGCGDAGLAQGLEKDKKKMKLQIFSYDLQNPSPLVTRADIADLPLKDDSVDIAIFCLALMGTNWVDFIEEAYRVLRWKGELWVAEIKSRFGRVGGKGKRVEHSVGNRKKQPDKKTLKKLEAEADDADLLIEVDGQDDNKAETDVSAFVEVLRKRGFVLQTEHGIDLSNRMFVTMKFAKGTTPMKGKGVPVPKGMEKMGMDTWKRKPKGNFVDEDIPVSSEASVLKPCVYKIR